MNPDDYISKLEHSDALAHGMGDVLPFPERIDNVIPGICIRGNSNFVAPSDHTHSWNAYSYEGVPTDALLVTAGFDVNCLIDGICILDTVNSRLYFRIAGLWKYTALV